MSVDLLESFPTDLDCDGNKNWARGRELVDRMKKVGKIRLKIQFPGTGDSVKITSFKNNLGRSFFSLFDSNFEQMFH